MDSILTTIKQLVGVTEGDTSFDTDIIIGINTALFTLTQLGVGPATGFSIQNKEKVWSDFLSAATDLEAVKTFIYLKVKLVFDPPANSALLDSINTVLDELTFRLAVQAGMTEA